jgi:vacuolar-type H+-ATPase subunit I/STV1
MPFWSRELPPELRDKDPREILEALKKLEEYESKAKEFETTKTDLETKLKNQTTEFEATKTKLQEIEANIAAAQQQGQQQTEGQEPAQPTSVWAEPEKYISERTKNAEMAALYAWRQSERINFRDSLKGRDRKIFEKYAAEIDNAMNTYPLAQQVIPKNWEIAFTYTKGLHEQELAKADSEASPFFSEPASKGGGQEEQTKEVDKLTAEEEEVCKKFHWSPEGYLQRRKEAQIHQSERGAFAHFPVPERKRA